MRPRTLLLLITLCIAACAHTATAKSGPKSSIAGKERKVAAWVEAHVQEQVDSLERMVNINSGTTNLEGVREIGEHYAKTLAALGMETEWIDLPASMNRAGHLVARHRAPNSKGKRILLIGHLDTVFDKDSSFQRFRREGELAYGPGTIDMKGGNGVILYALQALHATGLLKDIEVTVMFTGDEEQPGSPLGKTREALVSAVKESDVALGFESLVDHLDTATIARRGFLAWTLRVTGRQGHSSLIFSPELGHGAIFEAARILDGFRRAMAGQDNLSFSPGRILGGTEVSDNEQTASGQASGKANIIAKQVIAIGDLRALSAEQVAATQVAMQTIVSEHLLGTKATLEFSEGYPPMAPTADNQALLQVLNQINLDLGRRPIEAVAPMKRGAADISFAAPYVPSMGGLGLLGTGDHSPSEVVDLRSVPVATTRAALLIYRLSRTPR